MPQHCPNGMLQNHVWVKDPFRFQDRPMNFNVREYEMFINNGFRFHFVLFSSDSSFQLTFKKLPLVGFLVYSQRRIATVI